jgi:hypothetical protein
MKNSDASVGGYTTNRANFCELCACFFRSARDSRMAPVNSCTMLSLISRLPPAFAALLAHLPGLAVVMVLTAMDAQFALPGIISIISLSAALLAWLWQLPTWWRFINLFFLPATALAFYLQNQIGGVHPNWFLGVFLLLVMTSIGSVFTRVPLYLSSPRVAGELAARAPSKGRLIDLGCGLGGPLAGVHQLRPDVQLAGIEAAPLNWLLAKTRLLKSHANIRLGSLWNVDLGPYDIVYAYLSPAPMPRLWQKARKEMKPGSLFISNSFAIPDFEADEIVDIGKTSGKTSSKPEAHPGDLSPARLLIWRM